MIETRQAAGTYPVVEVFGPTVQGEGSLIGVPVMFVRLGYCDYRCSWCDSKYAVDPVQVKAHARDLTPDQIHAEIAALHPDAETRPGWVVLSGGNPAIHDCAPLLATLRGRHGLKVAVETQGTVWRDWLADCDHVTVSPKPPSSGNVTPVEQAVNFIQRLQRSGADDVAAKVVIFGDRDMRYAREMFDSLRGAAGCDPQLFLSVGNHVGVSDTAALLSNLRLLTEMTMREMPDVRVLPQLHVLMWGNARGV